MKVRYKIYFIPEQEGVADTIISTLYERNKEWNTQARSKNKLTQNPIFLPVKYPPKSTNTGMLDTTHGW